MSNLLKVGTKVRIQALLEYGGWPKLPPWYVGLTGVVSTVTPWSKTPYDVKLDDGRVSCFYDGECIPILDLPDPPVEGEWE